LNSRLNARQESTEPKEGVPIGDLLGDHIDKTAAASAKPDTSATGEKPAAPVPATESRPIASARKAGQGRSGSGLFGALSKYFSRHRGSAHVEPFMREKMRSNTLDHINKAMVLAKRGDAQGAKIHAGLAENAMRTAGEYMSDEEYRQFKEKVETRLKSVMQG
jgi:hypothetical protein